LHRWARSATGRRFSLGFSDAAKKKKVLHLDRNDYYGGASASLNLEQLYAK
jgi:RAB protein geranylgeranyltransferase component A